MKKDLSAFYTDFGVLKQYAALFDEELAVIDTVEGTPERPVKLDWGTLILVVSGTAVCSIDEKSYQIKKNDLLMCFPNRVLLSKESSADFQICCLCVSNSMIERLRTFPISSWDIVTFLQEHPVLSLKESECAHFLLYYRLLQEKMKYQDHLYYRESMQCVLQSFLYDFFELIEHYLTEVRSEITYSSGKNLFKNFLALLSASYPKKRAVSYYADKLNVTPKYLSSVCKQYSGKTASELIHQLVVKDISYLLIYSTKSIKEIMVELDFPSLSFFGKYVKKHFGVGPKEYRERRNLS